MLQVGRGCLFVEKKKTKLSLINVTLFPTEQEKFRRKYLSNRALTQAVLQVSQRMQHRETWGDTILASVSSLCLAQRIVESNGEIFSPKKESHND